MKFVHSADLHLDSPMVGLRNYEGAPVEQMRAATRQAAQNLVQLCIDEEAAFLLVAGDLFDGDWRDYSTGLFFSRLMSQLAEAGTEVFIVRGNHDAQSKLTRKLPLPGNVHVFSAARAETVLREELGVAFHGHSYAQQETLANLASSYPPSCPGVLNIALLHTALDGRPGHAPYAPCSLDDLKALGYDYWALGHVHGREVLCEDPWVVFPGNLQGRNVREQGAKGASVVTVSDGVIVAVEHRSLDVVRWASCEVLLDGVEDEATLLRKVQEAFVQAVEDADGRLVAVRLLLRGRTSLHDSLTRSPVDWRARFEALAIEVGSQGGELWVEKVRPLTAAPVDLEAVMTSDGPLGELLRSTRALRDDEAQLELLADSLKDLGQKLPAGTRAEGEAPLHSAQSVRQRLDQIEELLVARLQEEP